MGFEGLGWERDPKSSPGGLSTRKCGCPFVWNCSIRTCLCRLRPWMTAQKYVVHSLVILQGMQKLFYIFKVLSR